MEILLDIIRSVDYNILLLIADKLRGGVLDPVMTVLSLMGNGGAVWIETAVLLLFSGNAARRRRNAACAGGRLRHRQSLHQGACYAAAAVRDAQRPYGSARPGRPVVVPLGTRAFVICGGDGTLVLS
ncbi:MprA protease, GlyGly-CTERM protein-sorting domain-containing form [Butyricicoccus sp. AM29-23AC]|nr:MprA protease, GlyGly-CTERM protein-sorting domain-containing form [Butyricicoccus sp. AM29-23AC]